MGALAPTVVGRSQWPCGQPPACACRQTPPALAVLQATLQGWDGLRLVVRQRGTLRSLLRFLARSDTATSDGVSWRPDDQRMQSLSLDPVLRRPASPD